VTAGTAALRLTVGISGPAAAARFNISSCCGAAHQTFFVISALLSVICLSSRRGLRQHRGFVMSTGSFVKPDEIATKLQIAGAKCANG